jgi:hypothetical protein
MAGLHTARVKDGKRMSSVINFRRIAGAPTVLEPQIAKHQIGDAPIMELVTFEGQKWVKVSGSSSNRKRRSWFRRLLVSPIPDYFEPKRVDNEAAQKS